MKKSLISMAMEDAGYASLAQDDINTSQQIDLNVIGELYADDPSHIAQFAAECDRRYEVLEHSLAVLGDMHHLQDELDQVDPNVGITNASTDVFCKAVEEFGRQLGYMPNQVGTKIAKESYGVARTPQKNLTLAKEGLGDFIAKIFKAIFDMIKKIGEWISNGFKRLFGGGSGGGGGGGGSSSSRNDDLEKQVEDLEKKFQAHTDEHKTMRAAAGVAADKMGPKVNPDDIKPQTVPEPPKGAPKDAFAALVASIVRARQNLALNNFKALWFDAHEATGKAPEYLALELKRMGDMFIMPFDHMCKNQIGKDLQEAIMTMNEVLDEPRMIPAMVEATDGFARSFADSVLPTSLAEKVTAGSDGEEIRKTPRFLGNKVLAITLPSDKDGKSAPGAAYRHYHTNISVPEEYRKEYPPHLHFPILEYKTAQGLLAGIRKVAELVDKNLPKVTLLYLTQIADEAEVVRKAAEKSSDPDQRRNYERAATTYFQFLAVTQKLVYRYIMESKAYQVTTVRELQRYLAICVNLGHHESSIMDKAMKEALQKE